MKSLNLIVAIILIAFGTFLMIVSVNPNVSNDCGLLNAEACYAITIEATKTWFIIFLTTGISLTAAALLLAFLGRKRNDNVAI